MTTKKNNHMSMNTRIAVCAALLALVLSGCEKVSTDANVVKDALTIKPAALTKSDNGIKQQDGTIVYSIGSVFVGGGVASPSKGSSHRCHFYQEKFAEGPNWDEVQALVTIMGFRYKGVEYTQPGQYIDYIYINGIDASLGLGTSFSIPMEQGQYKGGNALVSDVRIVSYQFSSYNQEQGGLNSDANIHIVITTKAGDVITLLYQNDVTPYDGYY